MSHVTTRSCQITSTISNYLFHTKLGIIEKNTNNAQMDPLNSKNRMIWIVILAIVFLLFLVTCSTFLYHIKNMQAPVILSEEDESNQSAVDKKFQIWEKKMYLHSSAIKSMRNELFENKKRHESDLRRIDNIERSVKDSARQNILSEITDKIENKLNALKSEVNSLRMEVNHKYSDSALERLNQQMERTASKEVELENTANSLKDLVSQLQQQMVQLKGRLDVRSNK
jgi:flagellar basal body-associated protein FliL